MKSKSNFLQIFHFSCLRGLRAALAFYEFKIYRDCDLKQRLAFQVDIIGVHLSSCNLQVHKISRYSIVLRQAWLLNSSSLLLVQSCWLLLNHCWWNIISGIYYFLSSLVVLLIFSFHCFHFQFQHTSGFSTNYIGFLASFVAVTSHFIQGRNTSCMEDASYTES